MRKHTYGLRDLGTEAYEMFVQDESRWYAPLSPTIFSSIVKAKVRPAPIDFYRTFIKHAIEKARYGGIRG